MFKYLQSKNLLVISILLSSSIFPFEIVRVEPGNIIRSQTTVKVNYGKIIYNNNKELQTKLFELKYIGVIPSQKKEPFFIVSGRGCQGCDANISIYIHSPSDGSMEYEATQERFSHPGVLKNIFTKQIIAKSRAFFGEVLPGKNGVIWFTDYQGAISDYSEAIRIDPNYTDAYYNRGNTYELLNENSKAIADFKNAALLYKKNEDTTWFNKASQRIRTLEQNISQGEQTGTSSGVATIYDPPSNIRVRPNGRILCSVPTKGALISIQGQEGKWYRTDHCGSPGFIHRSQVRF